MRAQKFYDTIEELIDECLEIIKSKGLAYSGTEDSFANFKRVAKNLCMSPYQVWYTYFAKHLDSLSSWIREEYSDSEPIESRIKDLINYLFLLYGMIRELWDAPPVEAEKFIGEFEVDPEDEEHE